MPYLRMLLNDKIVDEVFIPHHLLQSILGKNLVEEEKYKLLEKYASELKRTNTAVSFCLDSVSSSINSFTPLTAKKHRA